MTTTHPLKGKEDGIYCKGGVMSSYSNVMKWGFHLLKGGFHLPKDKEEGHLPSTWREGGRQLLKGKEDGHLPCT